MSSMHLWRLYPPKATSSKKKDVTDVFYSVIAFSPRWTAAAK